MPIYEYRCGNCGEQVEVLVRSGTSNPPTCPNSGSPRLEKLLSVPYVISGERRPAGLTCCGREERCEPPAAWSADASPQLGVQKVAPCHCSGDVARRLFKEAYGEDFISAGVGSKLKIRE